MILKSLNSWRNSKVSDVGTLIKTKRSVAMVWIILLIYLFVFTMFYIETFWEFNKKRGHVLITPVFTNLFKETCKRTIIFIKCQKHTLLNYTQYINWCPPLILISTGGKFKVPNSVAHNQNIKISIP